MLLEIGIEPITFIVTLLIYIKKTNILVIKDKHSIGLVFKSIFSNGSFGSLSPHVES
jgi:hypothetical protein